jgi:8-oxo-dGTP diphosphatase
MSYNYEFPRPTVTADAIVFKKNGSIIEVLLVQRGNPPFEGMWAIPGGFIEMDEPLEIAASRELEEETGITGIDLQQFHTYGAVDRDPRHRTISVAYAGVLNDGSMKAEANDDAADCKWFDIEQIPQLGFDHNKIIADAINFGKQQQWF